MFLCFYGCLVVYKRRGNSSRLYFIFYNKINIIKKINLKFSNLNLTVKNPDQVLNSLVVRCCDDTSHLEISRK